MARERTTILIDSDIVAYRHSAAGELRVDWEDDGNIHIIPEDLHAIHSRIDSTIEGYSKRLKADRTVVCMSCPADANWRLAVLPEYKAHRDPDARPLHLAAAKEYMAEHWQCIARPTLEADDVMGILATHPGYFQGRKIIVSSDKDMQTIPGWWFNPNRHTRGPVKIEPEDADRFHLLQTLAGDPVDNYKGAPGIGPVKAERILDPVYFGSLMTSRDRWSLVVTAYKQAMSKKEKRDVSTEEAHAAALVQARVARICRHTDYDYRKKEVILWDPK